MTKITTLTELHQHISVLANVDESSGPFFSFYLDLSGEEEIWRDAIDQRTRTLRRLLNGNDLLDFEEALVSVEQWLKTEANPQALGAAIFFRGSSAGAFMLPMQFEAPLPNLLAVYPTPNIFHLIALKDNYHRYIVLLAMEDRATILEVNLGAATIEAWLERSELSERVGIEWSRSHYQIHRSTRGDRFFKEKIAILKTLMRSGDQSHLIIAGDPQITRPLVNALPPELANQLVDVIPASMRDKQSDIVVATLSSFLEHEERESQAVAEALVEGVKQENLAVADTAATMAALRWGEVDTLVMDSSYQPDPGWTCAVCESMGTNAPETAVCLQCGSNSVRPLNIKEALLRLAQQSDCRIEIVEHSSALASIGGVGCLLRYRPETQQVQDFPSLTSGRGLQSGSSTAALLPPQSTAW